MCLAPCDLRTDFCRQPGIRAASLRLPLRISGSEAGTCGRPQSARSHRSPVRGNFLVERASLAVSGLIPYSEKIAISWRTPFMLEGIASNSLLDLLERGSLTATSPTSAYHLR